MTDPPTGAVSYLDARARYELGCLETRTTVTPTDPAGLAARRRVALGAIADGLERRIAVGVLTCPVIARADVTRVRRALTRGA